ncbi:MAG: response regulator transcription factor [candidate division KSB1 bacterium]|nr:response regulator transcription factor [candidate division KSB1 bacterium]MDZ7368157.1 response regulator transcription factor [candidate division KSB1 bacterium]MDZ7405835.1 response regulator transcription factor [candidate division KSB1 bacterium]
MINVLIVDDHPIVRAGLKQILKGTADIQVAEEANNGQEALQKILENDFDVVLLDISMPGRSGLDILRELKGIKSDLHVLILSTFSEQQYAVRALKAGAAGYLTKESAPDELIAAIRKVSLGGKYLSMALAEKLAETLADHGDKLPEEMLSDREHQVMCMIASGKTVKEIATELSLSVKTISTYRRRILEKLKMKNNAEITHYAIQRGLVN